MALGPVGGIIAGIAINVAKDALTGEIHSWKDLGSSVAMGAFTGAVGAFTGGLGNVAGSLAGKAVARFGAGLIGKVAGDAFTGGVRGGVTDMAAQFATTGHVNLRETAQAVGDRCRARRGQRRRPEQVSTALIRRRGW